MALSRYLAHATLVFALASGCSQSLFDDGNGDNGPPGTMPPDGNPGTPNDGNLPPDASMVGQRDGGDPAEQDGGDGVPDGGSRPNCPFPCVGDAYGEFGGQQGGSNGRWRYLEVPAAEEYVDMAYGSLPDSYFGWQGTGTEPPTIVRCNEDATDARCSDFRGTLAFTSNSPAAHHPALRWTAGAESVYLVTATWRGSPSASPIQTRLTITHDNGALRTELARREFASNDANRVDADVSVGPGDEIVLSIQPIENGSVTMGIELFISVF